MGVFVGCWINIVFIFGQVAEPVGENRPKNIILMIGDGMGLTQITAGMIVNDNHLNLERFRSLGLIKTFSADDLITDSAAGATAFASGVKTNNGYVGVNPRGRSMPTIVEIAHKQGLGTGVVATSTIQHATPAAFYAHSDRRDMYEDITLDLLKSTLDLAMGGGLLHMQNRVDGRDVKKELEKKGYFFANSLEEAQVHNELPMMVIPEKGHMPSIERGRAQYLENASIMAATLLNQNEKGFFLIIEGSQIDWGGHANDPDYITSEMIDFDQAIGKILDFAAADGETLVIVTADHETGGFAIEGGVLQKGRIETDFTTDRHTATMIPVFAYGPGAENFQGIYENTEIFHKMIALLGLEPK